MHDSFRNPINPKPRHCCLRIPLKPLTLGHLFLLHEIKSPVLTGEPHEFKHLLTAALICAHWTHDEARKTLRRKLWPWVFGYYWGLRCSSLSLKDEGAKFFAYLKAERERPPTHTPATGQGRELAAPWEWIILDFLCTTHGLTKAKALNTTMLEANALWAVHWDSEGRVSLATAPGSTESLIKGIWRRRREAATREAEARN